VIISRIIEFPPEEAGELDGACLGITANNYHISAMIASGNCPMILAKLGVYS
jgi:hypothetical protein